MGEPYLLTPGPLTTSSEVKRAMLCDWGSWDGDFRELTANIRRRLLVLADRPDGFACVPMQGSGTYLVEAMLGTLVGPSDKVLVLANGAYGKRAAETLAYLGRAYTLIDKGDYLPPRGEDVDAALRADPKITHVIAIHCETSSGILNPIDEIAAAAKTHNVRLLIDSMSAFGAIPVTCDYDALVSSANKCIEGAPGFGFALVRQTLLEQSAGRCHSLSLDLHAQWANFEKSGQWRFTPPTHTIAAFGKALEMHEAEGGVAARGARYLRNRDTLVSGMRGLGFETLLADDWLSPIIVTFFNPAHPNFVFDRFYDLMKSKGFIIYPGKLTVVDSFRVGCIGYLDEHVMREVTEAARAALLEMGVDDPAPPQSALAERAKLIA